MDIAKLRNSFQDQFTTHFDDKLAVRLVAMTVRHCAGPIPFSSTKCLTFDQLTNQNP
jgi:hypothetical protein